MVRITKFRSQNPLTKEFWLENGERKSKSSKALAKGTGQIIECEFEKLGELMEDCDSHEVLCYGLNNLNTDDKFKVTTEEYEDPSKKIYARTKENFKFKKEPTVFFVDHDTNDGCPKMTPASLHKAFVDICPEAFEGAAYIERGSVSAGVKIPGKKSKKGGFHLYYLAADGTDLERFIDELNKRLWLAGLGYILITKVGSPKANSVIDACTVEGNRIDYTGAPVVGAGLEYIPAKAKYHAGGVLNTRLLKNLSVKDEVKYQKSVSDAKNAVQDKCDEQRAKYIEEKVQEKVKAGLSEDEAREKVNRQVECIDRQVLFGDFVLYFNRLGKYTVREVLQNHKKFENKYLVDPREEPPYPKTSSRFRWNAGKPDVTCWGHGAMGKLRFNLLPEDPDIVQHDFGVVDKLIEDLKTKDFAWAETDFVDAMIAAQDDKSDLKLYESAIAKLKKAGHHIKTKLDVAIQNRRDFLEALKRADDTNPNAEWRIKKRDHIREFNRKYALVRWGAEYRVLEKEVYPIEPLKLKTGFLAVHNNKTIQTDINQKNGEPVYKTLGQAWYDDDDRETYENGVRFDPAHEPFSRLPDDAYNSWSGLKLDKNVTPKSWPKIKHHIEKIVCDGDPIASEYLFNWIARTFQKPDKPAMSAVVLQGKKGAGKGLLLNFLRDFWGAHAEPITRKEHLVGQFNSQFENCCFLFADEAFYSGDKSHASVLKGMITEDTMQIEGKGLNIKKTRNFLKICMATNDEWAAHCTPDERRWAVFLVSSWLTDTRIKKPEAAKKYYDTFMAEARDEGCRLGFYNDMMKRDISKFSPGDIPRTKGLMGQIDQSMRFHEKWLQNCLELGTWCSGFEKAPFRTDMTSQEYHTLYMDAAHEHKISHYDILMRKELNNYLTQVFGDKHPPSVRSSVKNIRDLTDARKKFEAFHGVELKIEDNNVVVRGNFGGKGG